MAAAEEWDRSGQCSLILQAMLFGIAVRTGDMDTRTLDQKYKSLSDPYLASPDSDGALELLWHRVLASHYLNDIRSSLDELDRLVDWGRNASDPSRADPALVLASHVVQQIPASRRRNL